MSTARLCLVLLIACAITVAAIPAADDEKAIQEMVAAFVKAKNKEERVAALKNASDLHIRGLITILFDYSSGFRDKGEFEAAALILQWADDACAAVKNAEDRENCEHACLLMRALLEKSRERIDSAIVLYKKALAGAIKRKNHLHIVAAYMSLAAAQRHQGDYLAGLQSVKEGFAALPNLAEADRVDPEVALYIVRAQILMEIGDLLAAEKDIKEAQRIAVKHKMDSIVAAIKQDFAALEARRGRYAEAIAIWESALTAQRK